MAMIKALFTASALASLVSAVPMPDIDRRTVDVSTVADTVVSTTCITIDLTTTVYVNEWDLTPPPPAATTFIASSSAPAALESPATPSPAAEVSPANSQSEQPSPSASAADTLVPSVPTASAPESTVTATAKPGGPCEGQGSGCSGDITYYHGAGGLGACGFPIDDNGFTLALPVGLMGSLSNGNPYCGRSVSIRGTGGSIQEGTVADKCMGCSGHSIDLTPALFAAVASDGDGRVGDIEWWFT